MSSWNPDANPEAVLEPEKSMINAVRIAGPLAAIVGALALVEITSGVLQGYYTPILTDIARHFSVHDADTNWLEASQLMLSALCVPVLAKIGDLYGHRRVLIGTTAATALASFGLAFAPTFWTFLVAWALQGAYAVWLPLEVALIYLAARQAVAGRRSAGENQISDEVPALTRKAAGLLVAALETGVIVGALVSGEVAQVASMRVTLLIPALVVTACLVAVVVLLPKDTKPELAAAVSEYSAGSVEGAGAGAGPGAGAGTDNADARLGRVDVVGVVLLTLSLALLMSGLVLVRSTGVGSPWPWLLLLSAVALVVPFVRHERSHPEPIIDVKLLAERSMWPIQLTAGLFGVSVLGAQAPLSTFARTNPDEVGYGLGLTSASVSYIIGLYVITMLIGALLFAPVSRRFTPRVALIMASSLVALGYLMFLPFHGSLLQTMINMGIAGLGSGALVAALPAAAASAAPTTRTGMATGLTNTTKTIGGAIASAVFGVALFAGVSEAAVSSGETAAPLSGYMTVWALCGITAAICALLLTRVPKDSFTSVRES
ncbi:MFS transporter [Timonella senegalensis]|uniref:MFS transporter n=1 Tax=Timonella senegalensis TaxID=1465825 RepID=UPI0002F09B34|nr:MFS transporter [Timonella senegalensis]